MKFLHSSGLIKQYGCFKLVHFSEKAGRLSSGGPEIFAFGSHCSANFRPNLNCFIPNYKLKYKDSENITTDRATAVVFKPHQIKKRNFFGTPSIIPGRTTKLRKKKERRKRKENYHTSYDATHPCCISSKLMHTIKTRWCSGSKKIQNSK